MAQETGIPGVQAENDAMKVTHGTTQPASPTTETGIPGVVSKDGAMAVEIVVES